MSKKIEAGFFTKDDSPEVEKRDLVQAKKYLLDRIDAYVTAHPNTEEENINTVNAAVVNTKSHRQLLKLLWDHILAHPSEDLKVIK